MGSLHRKQRTIYVGEKECGSLREAAALSGISVMTLYRRLRYGEYFHGGVRIADTPPGRVFGEAPQRKLLMPLLRYPLGESPLDRGLPEARR